MGCSSLGIILTVLQTITYFTNQGTLLTFPVFFYFCFIQALEFRILVILLANWRWDLVGEQVFTEVVPTFMLVIWELYHIQPVLQTLSFWVPSQLQATWILRNIEHDITTEMLLKFQVFWLLWYVTQWKFLTFQRTFSLQQIRNFPLSDTASHLTRPECSETQLL